jgi:transposase
MSAIRKRNVIWKLEERWTAEAQAGCKWCEEAALTRNPDKESALAMVKELNRQGRHLSLMTERAPPESIHHWERDHEPD